MQQIFAKTRKNQLRAEYPLSVMGAIENEAALALKEGRAFKVPISIPKTLYAMPPLPKVRTALHARGANPGVRQIVLTAW
jgi:hypothetical protein